jgi:hypothetical protein
MGGYVFNTPQTSPFEYLSMFGINVVGYDQLDPDQEILSFTFSF